MGDTPRLPLKRLNNVEHEPGVQHFETKTCFKQCPRRSLPLVPTGSSFDNGWAPAKPWSWEGMCVSSDHGIAGMSNCGLSKLCGGTLQTWLRYTAIMSLWVKSEPQNSCVKLAVHPANTLKYWSRMTGPRAHDMGGRTWSGLSSDMDWNKRFNAVQDVMIGYRKPSRSGMPPWHCISELKK